MTAELEPGAVVAGRYRLDRRIGEGGMAIVWAATHLETGKAVALKHLRIEATGDADTRKRFLREARVTAAINHPNIIRIHHVVETPNQLPALIFDLLDGESLSARLARSKRLSVGDTASILLPVVSAVGAAHAIGIIHRDLKPDNIFLARKESGGVEIKVLDFGIAKLTGQADVSASSVITGSWALLGTPHYMSPEQIVGDKPVDHRSDIWALGAILYECLAGMRPAEGATPGKIFEAILLKGIRPLREASPGIPRDIADLVGRMLAREPEQRPWDLHDAARVLGRHTPVKAPEFGMPEAARPSDPGVALPGPSKPPGAKGGVNPVATIAADLRTKTVNVSWNEEELGPISGGPPATLSEPPVTLPAPEPPDTLPAPQVTPKSVKPPSSRTARATDLADTTERRARIRYALLAFIIAALLSMTAAWLLASRPRETPALEPPAPNGPTGSTSAICPPGMASRCASAPT